MMRRLFHQQGRKLEQQYPDSIWSAERVVWINYSVYEDADHILWIVLVRGRRSSDQFLPLAFLKGVGKAGDEDVLEDLEGKEPNQVKWSSKG